MIGITRRVDDLGRVVIPSDYRRPANIGPGTQVEVFLTEDNEILIRVHSSSCAICNEPVSPGNLGKVSTQDKKICKTCLSELRGV